MRVILILACLLVGCSAPDGESDDPSVDAIGVLNVGGTVYIDASEDDDDEPKPTGWTTPEEEIRCP